MAGGVLLQGLVGEPVDNGLRWLEARVTPGLLDGRSQGVPDVFHKRWRGVRGWGSLRSRDDGIW